MSEVTHRLKDLSNRAAQAAFRRLQPRFHDAPKWNPGRIANSVSLRVAIRSEVCEGIFCRSVYGPWLRSRFEDRTFRFAMRGMYGFFYADYLRDVGRGDFHFIDVGANIGLYSLIAGENPRCTAVDSFEPNGLTLEYLRNNLQRNDVSANVHPYAISSRRGTKLMREPDGHSGAATLEDDVAGGNESEVTLVGADYLREKFGLSSESLVLKIDVEGHEREVLGAFRDAGLLGRVTSVWVEVSSSTEGEARTLLEEAGFKATHAEGSGDRWDLLFERVVDLVRLTKTCSVES